MKFDLTTLAGAFGIAVLAAGSAQALTTISDYDIDGGALAPVVTLGPNTTTVTFGWTSVDATAFVEFTSTQDFSLYLSSYSGPTAGAAIYTGYVFAEAGPPEVSFTTNYSYCMPSGLAEVQVSCNLATNSTSATNVSENVGDLLFTGTAGTTYYLGIYEANNPSAGTIGFTIEEPLTVSEVPLPAGGLLLLGALGALGAARRRKSA